MDKCIRCFGSVIFKSGPNPFNNHRVRPGHVRPEVLSYWECQGECGEDWYKETDMEWAIRPFEEMRLGYSK